MQGDLALNEELRERYIPESVLRGEANLLIFPNLESANLSMTLLKEMNNALAVGPILMGPRAPAHILAPSVTSRGIVNMAAIAASEAVNAAGLADAAASRTLRSAPAGRRFAIRGGRPWCARRGCGACG